MRVLYHKISQLISKQLILNCALILKGEGIQGTMIYKSKTFKRWFLVGGVALTAAVSTIVILLVLSSRAKLIPSLSFQECLAYTTKGNQDAHIALAVIQDGETSFTYYGENGTRLAEESDRPFEIGSLTKTITAALILQAQAEALLSIDDTIDDYLDIPNQKNAPTIKQLLTHRSGYRGYYMERPMVGNFFAGRNSFFGVSGQMVLSRVDSIQLTKSSYPFSYSNFGYAVLGLALEKVYQQDYESLVNRFVRDELLMSNTHISTSAKELPNGWDWAQGDAYRSAGALISTPHDMAAYAKALLDGSPSCLQASTNPIASIQDTSGRNAELDIRMDSIGAAWLWDDVHGIVWHNGGTGHYNSYLGIDPARKIAVVVLSNLAPDYRIPATVLGTKLLLELQSKADE